MRLHAAAVGPTFVLMDDNARPHRTAIIDEYLESKRIKRMAWPAYLPHPIENLWNALGHAYLHVSHVRFSLSSLIELKTALQEEWRLLNSAVFDNLIESMVTTLYIGEGGLTYPIDVLFYHFMLFIFTLYIILFKSPVCHYLITYKKLILVSFLNIINDFVL